MPAGPALILFTWVTCLAVCRYVISDCVSVGVKDRPHLGAAQDPGQRDVVPLGRAFSYRGHRRPAGHVEGARQPVQLAALRQETR